MKEENVSILVHKRLLGTISAEEREQLATWTAASAANVEIVERTEMTWKLSQSKVSSFQPDVEKALQRFQQRIEADRQAEARSISLLQRRKWWSIALVAAAVVGVLFFWNNYQIAASGDWNTLATTTGEQQSVELADGTVVWLNENSQLDYPLAFGAERKVILRGEAFFDVAKDVDHPFVIETTGAEIDVLGTSFNVRAYAQEEQVVVAVRSGKVRFQPDRSNQNWTLTAKDKFTFDLAEKKYWQEVDETNNDWSWHSQKLQFKKTKLRQVLADLERHYQLKIELVNPALYDCRNYTGTFNQAKVEDILASLQTVFDLQMEREGNRTFRLIGGQCQ